jgi:hypothetical protein
LRQSDSAAILNTMDSEMPREEQAAKPTHPAPNYDYGCMQCRDMTTLIGDIWSSMGGQMRLCAPCWMSYWPDFTGGGSVRVADLLDGRRGWTVRPPGGSLDLDSGEFDIACMCPCGHGAITRLATMTFSEELALCAECVAARHVALAEPYLATDGADQHREG